jgi:hypothetical protein
MKYTKIDEAINKVLSPAPRKRKLPNDFLGKLNVLSESVLDWPRATLAPAVWDKSGKSYKLKPEVRDRILKDVKGVPEKFRKTIYLIGSICTYNYNDYSDLDIHLIPPEDASSKELERWKDYIKAKSGKLIEQHPINYYLHGPGEHPYADSTYDVIKDKWVQWLPIKKINLEDYYEGFRKAVDVIDLNRAELYRDIIDLEELRDAYDNASVRVRDDIEREIEKKIDEINEEIDYHIGLDADLKDKRNEALHSDFPDEDARSSLPDNVIYLLIRRYGYGALSKALKDLRKEKEEIKSPQDLKVIKKAFNAREFIERLDEKIKPFL